MFKRSTAWIVVLAMVCSLIVGIPTASFATPEKTVIVHYQRTDDTYKGWNLWVWPDGGEGDAYDFTHEDSFGRVAVMQIPADTDTFGFIVRLNDWEQKDVAQDRTITLTNGKAEIWVKQGQEAFATEVPEGHEPFSTDTAGPVGEGNDNAALVGGETTRVRVHYKRFDNQYDGWNLWIWPDGGEGAAYAFTGEDEYGKVAEFDVPGTEGITRMGMIVRLGEWEAKDMDMDRYLSISKTNDEGVLEVYLLQAIEDIYYDLDQVDLTPKFTAVRAVAKNAIEIESTLPFSTASGAEKTIKLVDAAGNKLAVKAVTSKTGEMTTKAIVRVDGEMDLSATYTLVKETFRDAAVDLSPLFSTKEFEEAFTYEGDDLGAKYSPEQTAFRLWAPTASEVTLNVYTQGHGGKAYKTYEMEKAEKGTWTATVTGDLEKHYYNYTVSVGDRVNTTMDPYAKAVGANGERGMILDLATTDPANWDNDQRPALAQFTDAVIYELHVRDLSTHPSSYIENIGKFLGLTETGTSNEAGHKTGLDHMKELGVTHVQLQPIYDYNSVDETTLEKGDFNWGYDPANYNAPEGSYATDPYAGDVRIRELKETIQALHDNDLRVVMDVVYNHTALSADSHLNKIVPGYYYRMNDGAFSNASGCGNETASERAMVRKMIIDSVKYWVEEYHVDGFRFDLMGVHDTETMRLIREELDKIDPSIIVYGEGWTGGDAALSATKRMLKKYTYKVPGVGAFNDDIRDGVKGHVFHPEQPGFVNGGDGLEESVKFGVVAATEHPQVDYSKVNYSSAPWADAPHQSINYVSAHDNLTLWDKFLETNPDDPEAERVKMQKLSNAIVLTSQGVPFLHAGVEMLRTKDGDHNSYRSSDEVNQIDWDWKTDYEDVFAYHKGLIAFRKEHPALRMTTQADIAKHLTFFGVEETFGLKLPKEKMVAYIINDHANGDQAGAVLAIFNGNEEAVSVDIPQANWDVYVDGANAGTEVLRTVEGARVEVSGRSALVMTSGEPVHIPEGLALAEDKGEIKNAAGTEGESSAAVNQGETPKPVWPFIIGGLALAGAAAYVRRRRNA